MANTSKAGPRRINSVNQLKRPEGTLGLYGCEIKSALDLVDALNMRLAHIKGIAETASLVQQHCDEVPKDTLRNAMYALVDEVYAALEAVDQFWGLQPEHVGEGRHD